jgi:hypothetical protein
MQRKDLSNFSHVDLVVDHIICFKRTKCTSNPMDSILPN